MRRVLGYQSLISSLRVVSRKLAALGSIYLSAKIVIGEICRAVVGHSCISLSTHGPIEIKQHCVFIRPVKQTQHQQVIVLRHAFPLVPRSS